VVLLPAASAADAVAIAEKMRQGVLDLHIPHAASQVTPWVTASFGVAALLPSDTLQPADLVAAADAALYKAKEQGRNQVAMDAQTTATVQ